MEWLEWSSGFMNDLAPAGITPAFVPPYGGRRVEIEGSRHELTKIYVELSIIGWEREYSRIHRAFLDSPIG